MTSPSPQPGHDIDADVVAQMIEVARRPETADRLLAILESDSRHRAHLVDKLRRPDKGDRADAQPS